VVNTPPSQGESGTLDTFIQVSIEAHKSRYCPLLCAPSLCTHLHSFVPAYTHPRCQRVAAIYSWSRLQSLSSESRRRTIYSS